MNANFRTAAGRRNSERVPRSSCSSFLKQLVYSDRAIKSASSPRQEANDLIAHIGNLGHSALILPASILVLGALLWCGRGRDALAFAAALIACVLVTLLTKLAFHACEAQVAAFDAASPSGHTSLSTSFYGCLTLIAAAKRKDWERLTLYAGGAILVGLIGVSRVITWAHTLPDVVLGLIIGALSVALFQWLRGPARPVSIPYGTIVTAIPVAAGLALILLLAARHWTPEPLIARTARQINAWFDLCAPPLERPPLSWAVLSDAPSGAEGAPTRPN